MISRLIPNPSKPSSSKLYFSDPTATDLSNI
nr:MAG TPA: hypothetical protein [Caudoviricetes sp.]